MLSSRFYLSPGEAGCVDIHLLVCLLPDVPLPSVVVPAGRMGAAGVGGGCWSCCCTQSPLAAPGRAAGVPRAGRVPGACRIPVPLGHCSPSLRAGCVTVTAEAGRRLMCWVSARMPGPVETICQALLPCSSSKHPLLWGCLCLGLERGWGNPCWALVLLP